MVEYTTHDISKQPQLISFPAATVYLKSKVEEKYQNHGFRYKY